MMSQLFEYFLPSAQETDHLETLEELGIKLTLQAYRDGMAQNNGDFEVWYPHAQESGPICDLALTILVSLQTLVNSLISF